MAPFECGPIIYGRASLPKSCPQQLLIWLPTCQGFSYLSQNPPRFLAIIPAEPSQNIPKDKLRTFPACLMPTGCSYTHLFTYWYTLLLYLQNVLRVPSLHALVFIWKFVKVTGQGKSHAQHKPYHCTYTQHTKGIFPLLLCQQERMLVVWEYTLLYCKFTKDEGNFWLGNFISGKFNI